MTHFNGTNKTEFLATCEELFKSRYTEDDKEFTSYLSRPAVPPPVIEMRPQATSNRSQQMDNYRHQRQGRNSYGGGGTSSHHRHSRNYDSRSHHDSSR